jgi:molecular chaperone Hsp33
MNPNALIKAISENKEAVIYCLDATPLVQESMERLNAWPPATKHLGQAMMGALLLQALSDGDANDSLSLQWMTNGPFGHCYAEAKNFGESRATILHPRAPVPDYATGLGDGLLQVRRKRNNFATTSVVSSKGDVSLDLVEYLEQSEQKSCGINFSVQIDWADPGNEAAGFKVLSALGYLIHILPQNSEQKMNDALVRWNRQMLSLGHISKWSLREDQINLDMLRLISGEENPKVVMNQRAVFQCNCTEERAMRALSLLETQEKKEGSFVSQKETEIRCEYCGRLYQVKSKKDSS